MSIKYRNVSWADHSSMLSTIIRQIAVTDDWKPDYIVGLARGGLIQATMLSHYFNVPIVPLSISLRDGELGCESNLWLAEWAAEGKKILIVDDINDTGATLNWLKKDWESSCPNADFDNIWGKSTRFAMLFDNEVSEATVDINYAAVNINKHENDEWIVFPWEEWWK